MSTNKVQYEKKTLQEQILLRPDTYIGNIRKMKTNEPIYTFEDDFKDGKMTKREVNYSDGLLRLFIEAISNAIDNVWRSHEEKISTKFIQITANEKTGEFSVWNDGKNIPTGLHPTEKVHIPEMIFGQLLTSSNYNDAEERKTSGKNGLGVKLACIFSNSFEIEIYNKEEKKIYKQKWTNNMSTKTEPEIITKNFPKTVEEGKNGYTLVKWTPDYKRFGYNKEKPDEDFMGQIKKCVLDCALTVSFYKTIVMYNGKAVPVTKIEDYIKFYRLNNICENEGSKQSSTANSSVTSPNVSDSESDSESESVGDEEDEVKVKMPKNEQLMVHDSADCKVFIARSDEYTHISFVNGIFTKDGGIHVDTWSEAIFRPILSKLNNSKKKDKIDIRDIKKHFFIFVFCTLDKPTFDSQSKTRLNGPEMKAEMKEAVLKKIMKWSFVKKIEESMKLKEMLTLKKTTERKKGTTRVEGLDDAKYAGKKPEQCIICISEGQSAKTFIIQGMKYGFNINGEKKCGRDWIGVLPIRGKFLNARNASAKMLAGNKEVISLIQSLGLQYGLDYTQEENRKKLRYHKLISACDNDVDGYHITGLLYNFLHALFPTVLQIPGFFNFMRVPIIKISYKSKELSFFHYHQAAEYIKKNNIKKDHIRYFKGLGTSNNKDIKEDFGRRIVQYNPDEKSNTLVDNVFNKTKSEFRKQWLTTFNIKETYPIVKDYDIEHQNVSDFINEELIQFSIDDCKRSIPSLIDGFKESYRKILYAAFKRNLKYSSKSLKVAQFAGYVAEHTNYHHGEMNLFETITKMAQRFVGSNNIPLLFNDGQFGTRLVSSGKDAANGRYIFTKLDELTRLIFREEDDDYLPNREDDGDFVEKEYYMPIIPTVLVNPTTAGIGTGWSCNIPAYNPKDLIAFIKLWLQNHSRSENNKVDFPEMKPWYKGFKGIIDVKDNTVTTYGVITKIKQNVYRITEIPIGRKMYSIERYKEKLEDLKEDGIIKDIVSDDHTDELVDFTVKCEKEPDYKMLGLVDTIQLTNMVLFDKNGKLKRYKSIYDILEEYCTQRYEFYSIRKKGEIKKMEHHIKVLKNKIQFINDIITRKLDLLTNEDDDVKKYLEKNKFDLVDESYDYLLSIQVRGMTKTKLENLREQLSDSIKALEKYKKLTEEQIWLSELKELEKEMN
jgi:DNA topoisomerase-2